MTRAAIVGALLVAMVLAACKAKEPPAASSPVPAPAATPSPTGTDPWADNGPVVLPPPKVTHPFANPLIWTATRDGKTTYLFGTLHGGVDAEHRIPLWVWRYFDQATTLIEEANIQDIEIARWTIRPEGAPTLRAELGEDYWNKFEEMVTPVIAGLMDTQATAVAALRVSGHGGGGRDAAVAMDVELLVRAQGMRKTIEFFETGQFQSKLFTELYDVATLRRLLDNRDSLARVNPGFVDAYIDGDAERLGTMAAAQFRLAVADDAQLARYLDRLLISRNRAWIPKIEAAHEAGGAFVAAGALHFTGKDNVLELLRARGFTVERATEPP